MARSRETPRGDWRRAEGGDDWAELGVCDLKHLGTTEALERFARCEPYRRPHKFAFGVMALESEPVDPRF